MSTPPPDASTTAAPAARHRKSVQDEPVTSVLPGGDIPYDPNREFDSDDEVLAALGYKPEFRREFSLFTTFCVSFAVLGLLPSFASTLYYGMGYAGTAGYVFFLSSKQMLSLHSFVLFCSWRRGTEWWCIISYLLISGTREAMGCGCLVQSIASIERSSMSHLALHRDSVDGILLYSSGKSRDESCQVYVYRPHAD